jgi:hypothetical protein
MGAMKEQVIERREMQATAEALSPIGCGVKGGQGEKEEVKYLLLGI